MKCRAFLIHALSPLHAGTGQAVEVIDLPIARMRSTGIPIVPGSSIKGVLRAEAPDNDETTSALFGPGDPENASDHAGALVVGDARLLALPVRSFRGAFAWVSSPLLLRLAKRDIEHAPARVPELAACTAAVPSDSFNVHQGRVFLEDLDLAVTDDEALAPWRELIAPLVGPEGDPGFFGRRFVVVDDETMSFLWETATQVDTRVRLKAETRTVADGALWVEESLPPESLLVGLLSADKSRHSKVTLSPDEVLQRALSETRHLQFGGKATVGRGRCRMIPIREGA